MKIPLVTCVQKFRIVFRYQSKFFDDIYYNLIFLIKVFEKHLIVFVADLIIIISIIIIIIQTALAR